MPAADGDRRWGAHLPAWQALAHHAGQARHWRLDDLFSADEARFSRFHLLLDGLLLDYSRNLIDSQTLDLLLRLADEAAVEQAVTALFAGDEVNFTERRPALHTALRWRTGGNFPSEERDVLGDVAAARQRMGDWVDAVREGRWLGHGDSPIRDVVNIGIGGSDLGPRMVVEALKPASLSPVNVHFLANVDGTAASRLLAVLEPATTLFIINSKSFSTLETFTNAATAKRWLLAAGIPETAVMQRHFVAVSANQQAAAAFGLSEQNRLPIWDWVGGRYSLWSASGLAIPMAVGMPAYEALLDGAAAMDEHFRTAPLARNLPVIMGLLGVWYGDFLGAQSHAVVPYDERLALLPAHLQQLDMESNGKRIDRAGEVVAWDTGPVVWGAVGTNGQHAFFQLLHQGTRLVPADLIGCVRPAHELPEHHHQLLANLLAQGKALMQGRDLERTRGKLEAGGLDSREARRLAPHQTFPGNRPSNTLLLRALDARTLGMLVALYEHKVFVQSVLWGINAFDQYGVELGKAMAKTLIAEVAGGKTMQEADHDPSTAGLLRYLKYWASD